MTDYQTAERRFASAKRNLDTLKSMLTYERLTELRQQTNSSDWRFALINFAPDPMKIASAAIKVAEHELDEARSELIATLNAEWSPPAGMDASNIVAIPKRKTTKIKERAL